MATAPQLKEELKEIQELINTRERIQQELLAALDKALESDDKDAGAKLKRCVVFLHISLPNQIFIYMSNLTYIYQLSSLFYETFFFSLIFFLI